MIFCDILIKQNKGTRKMQKKILVSISSLLCISLSALSISTVMAVANEGPYDKEPRCFICDIAPRDVQAGKLQPFCSRVCHKEFDAKHNLCLECGKNPRYINEAGKQLYCTPVCGHKHLGR